MTTVVTGASGHVGVNLIRGLLARGRTVRALVHNNRQPLEALDIEFVNGDICDPASLQPALRGADCVYHLACRISLSRDDWPLLEATNVRGTRNVVAACIQCGVRRLVHFSSIHALVQEPYYLPVDESRPLVEPPGYTPYDLSKADSDREVLQGIEQGLDAIILYPTAIVGPDDHQPSLFGEALLALAQHKLPALIPGGFDWVDVRDIAEGAIRAEEAAVNGTRYVLSGHWVSILDMAAVVAELSGTPAPALVCPTWLARLGAPFITFCDRLRGRRTFNTRTTIDTLQSNRHIRLRPITGGNSI